MKILITLILIPFKIIGFLLSVGSETDYHNGDGSLSKSKIEYQPVGKDNELIQVVKNR